MKTKRKPNPVGPLSRQMSLSPAFARALLGIRFSRKDIARMNELSGKASEGRLSSEERKELEDYISSGTELGILKSRARLAIKANAGVSE